jgi:streptogramin lyase
MAIEGSEPKLAVDRGSVWILTPAEGSVTQVDPLRGTVKRRISLVARGISAGGGAVWVADKVNAVWRFDGGRSERIPVGAEPQDVVATSKDVWVADYGDRTLVRVAPTSRRVLARIKLDHHPAAVAAGGGIVAVALFGESS